MPMNNTDTNVVRGLRKKMILNLAENKRPQKIWNQIPLIGPQFNLPEFL